MIRVLVTGAGGFIGSHLTEYLVRKGFWVRGVDLKYPPYRDTACHEFQILDLRIRDHCMRVTEGVDEVYALASDMGGMGYIGSNQVSILHHNSLIDLYTLEAAHRNRCKRLFYSSSACVYPDYKQREAQVVPLKEEDAYPADPQGAYGLQKLVTEKLCQCYREENGLDTRIARFHNIFGPEGDWMGGREKAPLAICRKVAQAKLEGKNEVEIWGDGEQTRSFCYIDDCLKGMDLLMHSDYHQPLNIGQERLVTINELVDIVSEIAEINIVKKYVTGPQGVRGRNSDNSHLKSILQWEPRISLEEGLSGTYKWVEQQVRKYHNVP